MNENSSNQHDNNTTLPKGRNKGFANLRPWKPGQSGNPSGRPPAMKALNEAIREFLAEPGRFPEFVDRLYKEDILEIKMLAAAAAAKMMRDSREREEREAALLSEQHGEIAEQRTNMGAP